MNCEPYFWAEVVAFWKTLGIIVFGLMPYALLFSAILWRKEIVRFFKEYGGRSR